MVMPTAHAQKSTMGVVSSRDSQNELNYTVSVILKRSKLISFRYKTGTQ